MKMDCPDCAARRQALREALINSSITQAVTELAKGAAEVVGLKPKTGASDLRQKSKTTGSKSGETLAQEQTQ